MDTGRLQALNEAEPDSLKHVLRPWHERNNGSLPELESDADEQLLLKIPFTSPVGIRSLCVIGGGDTQNPATIKAFINKELMDFETAEAATGKAVQQVFELVERNPNGDVEYPTKYTKFQNVSTLWLLVQRNFGADTTRIRYIGLKGTFTRYKREAVHTVYEARATKASKDVMNAQHNQYAM